MVQARILEISRTKLRELGYDFHGKAVSVIDVLANDGMGKADHLRVFAPGHKFFDAIEALEKRHLVKLLAEPNLVTVSNRPSYVSVGGEIPVPKPGATAAPQQRCADPAQAVDNCGQSWLTWLFSAPSHRADTAIEFKEYGTRLDVVPIVLADRRIHLEVRARVSTLDPAHGIMVDGMNVPGLRTREVETGVKLTSGDTLVLGGLVENEDVAVRTSPTPAANGSDKDHATPRVVHATNEVETLVLLTPKILDATAAPKTKADPLSAPTRPLASRAIDAR
jgi:pilus assembly protein CpaC